MRELAHLRWSIEREPCVAFRALNAAVNSKHVWTRGANAERTWEVLMLLMFLAFTLVLAYHAHIDSQALWESRGLRRLTPHSGLLGGVLGLVVAVGGGPICPSQLRSRRPDEAVAGMGSRPRPGGCYGSAKPSTAVTGPIPGGGERSE